MRGRQNLKLRDVPKLRMHTASPNGVEVLIYGADRSKDPTLSYVDEDQEATAFLWC